MGLSFTSEMQITLPDYFRGVSRYRKINKLLTINESWQEESFSHAKLLLRQMKKLEASDLDMGSSNSEHQVWFRIFGDKKPAADVPKYDSDEVVVILLSVLTDEQKVVLFDERNIDFSLGIKYSDSKYENRFRGCIYFENGMIVGNFRKINEELFPIKQINIPIPVLQRMNLKYEKAGLVIVTGITGSGKSSTLDAVINMNNEMNDAHIVILANPIEFVHRSKRCIIRQREIGDDVVDFKSGTKQSLRQDPDIIMVGEMRDPDTIRTVLEVTDSGHKVFTTLHTSSAVESIHRMVAEFPANEQDRIRLRLADTLSIVLSQKLVPDRNGRRVLAKEILNVNSSVRAAIRNKNIDEIYQMITQGKNAGMYTMEQNLNYLFQKNIITEETALNYSNSRKRMKQIMSC